MKGDGRSGTDAITLLLCPSFALLLCMINGKVRGKQRRHSLRIVVCRLLPDLTDWTRHGLSIRRDGTGSGVADEIGGSSALNGHDPQACGVLADADDYSFEDRGGCMRAKGAVDGSWT